MAAGRRSALDVSSTLSGRRDVLRRFTMERYAHVPAVLGRLTRFASDLDEDMELETVREHVFP